MRHLTIMFAALPAAATVALMPSRGVAVVSDRLTWEQALACVARVLAESDETGWCVNPPEALVAARGLDQDAEALAALLS